MITNFLNDERGVQAKSKEITGLPCELNQVNCVTKENARCLIFERWSLTNGICLSLQKIPSSCLWANLSGVLWILPSKIYQEMKNTASKKSWESIKTSLNADSWKIVVGSVRSFFGTQKIGDTTLACFQRFYELYLRLVQKCI